MQQLTDQDYILADLMGWKTLAPLVDEYPFLPFTGAAARPFCLAHILNEVVLNQRESIIEFGAGISTILIARLIKKNTLNARLITIEHDLNWSNKIQDLLNSEGLHDIVDIVYAPLSTCIYAIEDTHWYNLESLEAAIGGKQFDLAIIDGPPAWKPEIKFSRYAAVPFLLDKLKKERAIFLDDAIREGEKFILELWQSKYGIAFDILGHSLAYHKSNGGAFTQLYSYYK